MKQKPWWDVDWKIRQIWKSSILIEGTENFGLGLSIAAKLAEIQGIGLEVEDTEGGGSTFRVEIRK